MARTPAWDRLIESIRAHPWRGAAVAGTGLAAVATGALFAMVLNREPSSEVAAGDPSPTATASQPEPSATASPSSTPSPSASPSASPTPTASATAGAAATATPVAPTTPPTSYPTPEPPSWDIEGSWTALPPMPDADRFAISDVLLLQDGRLLVVRWRTGHFDDGSTMLTYDVDDRSWQPVSVATEVGTGTDQPFAQAGDGRIYTFAQVIDPSVEPWTVEPITMVPESDVYAGYGLDAGPGGLIYRPAADTGYSRTQLMVYDPATGAFTRSSFVSGGYASALGTDELVYAVDMSGIVPYDPVTDEWGERVTTPGDQDVMAAGVGPDGRIYMRSMWDEDNRVVAWDPDAERWLTVEPPVEAGTIWRPRFVTGPDGRLWALDGERSFIFEPAP